MSAPVRISSWALGRGTTACFTAGVLLLLAVWAVTYRAFDSFAETSARVAQTHQIQAETGHLQRAIIDAATARRAYTTAPEERHIETFRQAAIRAREHLDALTRLTADNPRQRAALEALDRLLSARLNRAVQRSTLLPAPLPPPASTAGAKAPSSNEELLSLLAQINAEEQRQLRGREHDAKSHFELAKSIVPAGTLGSVLLLILALFLLNREARDRKRTQAELTSSERHHRVLFESSPMPMWVYDLETLRFLAVNKAAIHSYGFSREEFLAMTIKDIRPPEDVPDLLRDTAIRPPVASFRSSRIWRHLKKDGTIIRVEITSHDLPFRGRDGRLVLANDVTARVQAEEALQKLNTDLEQRVRERTEQLEHAIKELEAFSYSVSHDLRAPLRHVQGYVAMLQRATEGQLPEKAQRHLKIINDSSVAMGQLIDDLLEFSRMGRVEMSAGRVSLDDVLRDTLQGLELATHGRNIVWKIAPLPAVIGDASMLRQVFNNLVGNAVKYTRQRDPAEIEIGTGGEENGRAIVFVRDNGAGFDMQYAHKLFGVFQRLHRSDEFEGTGIGLATVRRVVSRHGGRVWAESAVGQGATFFFTVQPADNPSPRTPIS